MKKIAILILLALMLPVYVNAQAKYEVESISLIETEGSAAEKNPATFKNGKLIIDAELKEQGDYLKYHINIKNTSNSDLSVNVNTSELNNNYIKYSVNYEDDNPIIDKNKTKKIELLIKMEEAIPTQDLLANNGIYIDKKTISISLNHNKSDNIDTNPLTANNLLITILLIVLLIIIATISLTMLIKYKKMRKFITIFLIVYASIPPHIIALEKVDLVIESNIEVNKKDTYTIRSYVNSQLVYTDYFYVKGMTGLDYLEFNSDGTKGGFYIAPNFYNCDSYGFTYYGMSSCLNENNYNYCSEKYPSIYFYTSEIQSSSVGYYYYTSCCLTGNAIVETMDKKTKKRKKKKLKDLSYDDLILVWDFDNGCLAWAEPLWIQKPEEVEAYYELKFDNGTILEIIGDHKIYNSDLNRFVNCIEDNEFEIGSHTINENNEVLTLISKERIEKPNIAYNVISKNHINVIANGLITTWKINNLYEIEDNKYNKDTNIPRVELDKNMIPEEYFEYLRLQEIPYNLKGSMEETQKYIYNLIEKLQDKKL